MDSDTAMTIRYAILACVLIASAFLKVDILSTFIGLAGGLAIPTGKIVEKVVQ